MGLTLLAQAQLPFKFWFDAFVSAVYFINRLPTEVLSQKSPFECLFHKVPDYTFLKTFDCACYPFLRPYNSHKFQYRTSKCLFLGYSPAHKGYRCLHPSGKLYIAKTVHFDESDFPYSSLFHTDQTCVNLPHSYSTLVFVNDSFSQHHLSHLQLASFSSESEHVHPITTESLSHINTDDHTSALSSPLHSHSSDLHDHVSDPSPNSQHPSHDSPPLISPIISHPMITRSKNGIFKPKQFPNMALLCENSLEPTTVSEALSHPEWKQAMEAEFQALLHNDTWELVPYTDDMNIVTNKWVFRVKYKVDGTIDRFKAHLVAKGFQQLAGADFLQTFSPVVKSSTIRVVFSLAVTYGWDIQ